MKFYVVSRDVKVVIAGPHITSAREAAKEAMLRYLQQGVTVASCIIVSELGFDLHFHPDGVDEVFDTAEILEEAGFLEAEPNEDNDNENNDNYDNYFRDYN